ncbi:HlyD family secretion protein [Zavarzinia aquatilis]|uniref:Secretion protein HlyD n=1 Tax=Zavarzinia aquatilis TaxID=2211142 RepID=A0A317DXJ4_9PROT|nr:HlyD family efflux transporter periplasmic adaptor subunit [Zavarzinia aquatilis]PWR19399.1 secretion protein HlyD [Zavarzinia aquatilis]
MRKRLAAALLATLGLAACDGSDAPAHVQGYAEGEFVAVAPTAGGRLTARPVTRGMNVAAGALLFTLDDTEARANRDRATASLAEAKSRLADLEKGARPEDLAVIDARIAEAKAALDNAELELTRTRRLEVSANASRQALDRASSTAEQAAARLASARAERAAAVLPARADQLDAARANVAAAEATLAAADWQLSERRVTAPVAGIVSETLRDPGESIAAGTPVLTLLPPDAVKVRFFLPEPLLPKVTEGGRVTLACDGCPAGLAARISYIAPKEEFTPPTVYTVQNRRSFVFLVEARPEPGTLLRPGQPLDVTLVLP